MNQVTGLNKPASPAQASSQNRAQQILALAKPAAPSPAVQGATDIGIGAAKAGVGMLKSGDVLDTINRMSAGEGIDKTKLLDQIKAMDVLGTANKLAGGSDNWTGIEEPAPQNGAPNWTGQTPEQQREALAPSNNAQKVGAIGVQAALGLSPIAKEFAPEIRGAANTIKEKMTAPSDDVPPGPAGPSGTETPKISSLKVAAAKGSIPGVEGVGKQALTSAQRLSDKAPMGGVGAAIIKQPVEIYDEFAAQEAKHLGDIKEDPAISLVGNRIGDAFRKVVQVRQAAGKQMANSLKKTASKIVNAKSPFGAFQKELLDNGASYDALTKELKLAPDTKFATPDKVILDKYATELQALGNKPTMKALDAFVSRMPKEIEGLKSTNKIEFKTNAERIIKNNLDGLRSALTKTGTKTYARARSTYSDLSNFIDEGASHLGKITQSGDFTRDASMAKSSVQSVLNNGKKDWLMKLEDHTGYPAMDEATLALQAMKDAGDFKGNSLLELLTEGGTSVPTSPSGLAGRIIGYVGKKATDAALGSPTERTREFLRSLEK